jgi:hypothetical protein
MSAYNEDETMTLSHDADHLPKSNISQVVAIHDDDDGAGGRGGARSGLWCAEQARPTHTCVLVG